MVRALLIFGTKQRVFPFEIQNLRQVFEFGYNHNCHFARKITAFF
jgi:hypothetical protein